MTGGQLLRCSLDFRQVVALPPVEAVVSGAIKTSDIPACNEKVDIWALGVTLYELLTGAGMPPRR